MIWQITKYCIIRKQEIIVDNNLVFKLENISNFADFIKAAYKNLGVTYPKFYKMDKLSKLAFVASELLLGDEKWKNRLDKTELAVVISNGSSTIDTDTEFQNTINDRAEYFPSPAVFVYTLPNIMIGEICIRNGLFGENALLIQETPDPTQLLDFNKLLLKNNKAKACLTGWADFTSGDNYGSVLMLVEKTTEGIAPFNEKGLLQIGY